MGESAKEKSVRRTYKPWTTTEEAFLREHYPAKGGKQVALELGRPYQSVNQKASLLGLQRKFVDMADWGLDEIKAFCRVDATDDDACWMWRGYGNTADYPYLTIGGKPVAARRRVFEMSLGRPVRANHAVQMKCQNPLCLNPAHMAQQPRNRIMQASMSNALRVAKITATQRRRGKLDEQKVQRILASNETAEAMAAELNVSTSIIYRVRNGRSWGGSVGAAVAA